MYKDGCPATCSCSSGCTRRRGSTLASRLVSISASRPETSPRGSQSFLVFCRKFKEWRDPDSNRGHHDFQIQKPLGMRKTRVGKQIYVHRVPLDTSWFCPYCCATVDTSF